MKYTSNLLVVLIVAVSVVLAACGGDGGGGSSTGGTGGTSGGVGGGTNLGLTVHEGASTGPQIQNNSSASGIRVFPATDITAGPSPAATFFVVNSGTIVHTATLPAISGSGAGHFSINSGGFSTSVPGSGSTNFAVSFNPTGLGSHSANVTLSLDGAAFSFEVTGSGVSAAQPGVSISNVSMNEGDTGNTAFSYTVSISSSPTSNVSVDWATADDTATSTDYSSASGTLTFTAGGATSQTVSVNVTGDTTVEATERFFVNLSNLIGPALITGAQGIGTIVDDDNPNPTSPVQITFVMNSFYVGGYGCNIEIKNVSNQPINGWLLSFDLAGSTIVNSWNADHTVNGVTNTFDPTSSGPWMTDISVGQTVTVGYRGNGTLNGGSVTNGIFSSVATTITVDLISGMPPAGGPASGLRIPSVDGTTDATQVTVPFNTSTSFPMTAVGVTSPAFTVETNNPTVVTPSFSGSNLVLLGIKSGRAGLRITETSSGTKRYIGVRVKDAAGNNPGMPEYISMGSVSEDVPNDIAFWRDFDSGLKSKRMDLRYVYLNGGPAGATEPYNPTAAPGAPPHMIDGWYDWAGGNGARAVKFIRESRKWGMIPSFVYYCIASGGESYDGDLTRIRDKPYMEFYYKDLVRALEIAKTEGQDDIVQFIFEPDFIGYLAQLHLGSNGQPIPPTTPKNGSAKQGAWAETSAAYSSGVLDTNNGDPLFPDTFRGLIESINYIASKYSNVEFCWQMNVWAYPAGGFTGINPPGTGVMHKTDGAANATDFTNAQTAIYNEARAVTRYYLDCGIGTHGADYISIDKYGLDGAAVGGTAPTDPASSIWFWNADHWNNYIRYCAAIHDESNLPVILWQIPVGRINNSQESNPYNSSALFPTLPNTSTKYECSSAAFFLGDTFIPGAGNRYDHFSKNLQGDSKIFSNGSSVTWSEHVTEAKNAGIISILFGAGVGISTDAVGNPPADDYWWITKIQKYYQNPVIR